MPYMCDTQVVTKLPGMDSEADLTLGSKKEQAELLTAVLKASDDDADEEVVPTSVSKQQEKKIMSTCIFC